MNEFIGGSGQSDGAGGAGVRRGQQDAFQDPYAVLIEKLDPPKWLDQTERTSYINYANALLQVQLLPYQSVMTPHTKPVNPLPPSPSSSFLPSATAASRRRGHRSSRPRRHLRVCWHRRRVPCQQQAQLGHAPRLPGSTYSHSPNDTLNKQVLALVPQSLTPNPNLPMPP